MKGITKLRTTSHPDFSDSIIVETGPNPQACIIWLHGLGASSDDFVPIAEQLPLPKNLAVRFIFPQAPIRPVAINNNMPMPAWFDIYSLDRNLKHDHAGIEASERGIDQLIQTQLNDFDSRKILIAGFSQGGAMALFSALRYPKPLGAVLGLSTYFPYKTQEIAQFSVANKSIPIFLAHGEFDEVLTLNMGEETKMHLIQQNYNVEWHEYPMAHSVCAEEIVDIAKFILRVLVN